MTLALEKLGDALGVAATGIDLNRPLDGATAEALNRALLDNLVLCIRGQSLTPAAYLAAMRGFGRPLPQVRIASRHAEIPEIMILSSEDRDVMGDGKRLVVGAHWHSDDSYKAVPCSLTMLYGLEVPEAGGDTQFTNMYRAYDDLSPEMKERIAKLNVVHKYDSPRKGTAVATLLADEAEQLPDVVHPLVRRHPETDRRARGSPSPVRTAASPRSRAPPCRTRSPRSRPSPDISRSPSIPPVMPPARCPRR